MTDTEVKATCHLCSAEIKARPAKAGGVKTPKGWRKTDDGLRCRNCTKANYLPRSIRLGLVGPTEGELRTREEMYAALNQAARDAAGFANWYIQQLYKAETGTLPLARDKKLPPLPNVDFYREGCTLFTRLAPTTLVTLAQMVRGWYSSDRFEVLLLKKRQVRTFKWDELPIPIHGQSWKLRQKKDGKFAISAQIGPGKSWQLDVFADGRAVKSLKDIYAGEAETGTLSFVRRRRAKRPGESTPPPKVWQVRISALLPRPNRKPRQSHQEVTLTLGHDPGCLLFGALDGDDTDVFECSGVWLRETIVGGDRSDRRHQIEASMARGVWSKRKLARWSVNRTAMSEKRNRKIGKLIELYAAELARWCVRNGVTSVDYDITDRGFLPHCPYRKLRDRIKTSLENVGIALHVLGDESDEDSAALAGPNREPNGKAGPPVTSQQSQPGLPGESAA